jgi:hypothetical protein
MLGSGSSNLDDTQEVLAQLEACQDKVDTALAQSEFKVVIDLNESRNSILTLAIASKINASCDTDIKRLAALQARAACSMSILKARMKKLGVNTGRHKRALVGYQRGL